MLAPTLCVGGPVIMEMSLWLVTFRFRSFTRHYFRKADGILVMYDVTSAPSFHHVRDWLGSIQVCTYLYCLASV